MQNNEASAETQSMRDAAVQIRPLEEHDLAGLWSLMEPAVRAGDTLAIPMDARREDAIEWWIGAKDAVFVAESAGQLMGTSYLRPNQLGHASHVANAGYIVAPAARGRGVATDLCRHSIAEARQRGYLAMQFNFVVETNQVAVQLWQKLGFEIRATIPRAFRHPTHGLVGAHVMWQWIGE